MKNRPKQERQQSKNRSKSPNAYGKKLKMWGRSGDYFTDLAKRKKREKQ